MARTGTDLSWLLLLPFAIVAVAGQAPPREEARPASPPAVAAAFAAFDRFFDARPAEQGIVGASFALLRDHRVAHARTFGVADLRSRRPVDAETIFHWASITKTFTAIGIMQLRDRGLLSLDDPIVAYVPELRQVYNPYGPMDAITLRMLMSHSAGFRNPTWPWGGDQDWHPFEPPGWAQVAAMLPYTKIEFPPGSKYSYSNPGIIFLGRVLERLTGDDYEVYIDKNILKPLEMYRSFFDAAPYHLRRHRSHSYFWRNGAPVEARFDFDTGVTVSNGGLNAPLADMAKYLRFLLGATPGEANPIPRATLEEMWQVQAPSQAGEVLGTGVGLGYFIEQRGEVRLIGHTGSQAGFRSFFWIHPESGLGIIANFNTAAASDEPGAKPNTGRVFQGMIERFVKVLP